MDEVEAGELLAGAGVTLGDDDLANLVRRTEGWPVGLYLAALAGAGRPGAGVAFHGDDRLMADYLHSEVLASLSRPAAVFLTRTSVLDQLSGPCATPSSPPRAPKRSWSRSRPPTCMLVPLDRTREWYRCHHLLLELLQYRAHAGPSRTSCQSCTIELRRGSRPTAGRILRSTMLRLRATRTRGSPLRPVAQLTCTRPGGSRPWSAGSVVRRATDRSSASRTSP